MRPGLAEIPKKKKNTEYVEKLQKRRNNNTELNWIL